MMRLTSRPAILPASLVAWRCESLKYAGTVMTASLTLSPRYSSASRLSFCRIIAEISGGVYVLPPISTMASPFGPAWTWYGTMVISSATSPYLRPMKRLIENTVFSIKRFMGRKYGDVAEEMTIVPYHVQAGPNGDAIVEIGGKTYTPPEISAMILQKLKRDAEEYLGDKVNEAVITVPAYLNDSQRQATKDAGKIAGLEVKRIINEPTAAALAYGLDKEHDQTILVFDLGGGTFDVSILALGDGVFEVRSTNGDTTLGGDNFDKAVVDWMVAEFLQSQGIDLSKDKMALQRLYEAAEKAKIELSTTQSSNNNLPFISADENGPKHLDSTLTRAKFDELTHALLERVVTPVNSAIKDAGLGKSDIHHVILSP